MGPSLGFWPSSLVASSTDLVFGCLCLLWAQVPGTDPRPVLSVLAGFCWRLPGAGRMI